MPLKSCEYKDFQFGDNRVVLDIHRNMLFQLDELALRILGALQSQPDSQDGLIKTIGNGYSREIVQEALEELELLELVQEVGRETTSSSIPNLPEVRALCLSLVHDCNMHCSYCFAAGGQYGTPGAAMSYSTAVQAIEWLLAWLREGETGMIAFFGGEPLLRWKLLKRLIPHIRQREEQEKKKVHLSITTNGTLLSEKIASFLHQHDVLIQISLDGPAHIHDRFRVFPNGDGSYERIARNIEHLRKTGISFYARATLDPDGPQVFEVVDHLLQIGANYVHAEPASGMENHKGPGLSPLALEDLKQDSHRLKDKCIEAIQRESRLMPIHAFIRVLVLLTGASRRRFYGCEMGRSYLAVSPAGELYPCHRFLDQRAYLMGDVKHGLYPDARQRFANLHVDHRDKCRDCWARYLCGGGCYCDGLAAQGGLEYVDPSRCDLARETITEAVEIAAQLSEISLDEIRAMFYLLSRSEIHQWNSEHLGTKRKEVQLR